MTDATQETAEAESLPAPKLTKFVYPFFAYGTIDIYAPSLEEAQKEFDSFSDEDILVCGQLITGEPIPSQDDAS